MLVCSLCSCCVFHRGVWVVHACWGCLCLVVSMMLFVVWLVFGWCVVCVISDAGGSVRREYNKELPKRTMRLFEPEQTLHKVAT